MCLVSSGERYGMSALSLDSTYYNLAVMPFLLDAQKEFYGMAWLHGMTSNLAFSKFANAFARSRPQAKHIQHTGSIRQSVHPFRGILSLGKNGRTNV